MDYSIFDPLLDGVLVIDSEGKVIYSNDAARMLGGDTISQFRKGKIFSELGKNEQSEFVKLLNKSDGKKSPTPYKEISLEDPTGHPVKVQVSVQSEPSKKPGQRKIVYLRDVTLEEELHQKYKAELAKKESVIKELKEAQDRLLQFSKTAVLGQFIASINHELNNPLTYLLTSSEQLVEILDKDKKDIEVESARKLIFNVHKGALRIMQLSNHLRNFLHSPLELENFIDADFHSVIDSAIGFTEHFVIKQGITVKNNVPAGLPTTLMDPALIEQLAINLIRNSADAMSSLDPDWKRLIEISGSYDAASNAITISFSDSGPGISPELMKKLFSPFFTTKPMGQGTGLGLSICLSIAEKHGGTLTAQSLPGKGATFYLVLPVKKLGAQAGEEKDLAFKGLKVLLVDDEPWILALQKTALTQLGCEVYEAENGLEALKQCKQHPPDVVITDLSMPEMTGLEFASKVKKLFHDTKIVLLTGSINLKNLGAHQSLFDELLKKPFPKDMIHRTIAKVIGKKTNSDPGSDQE